MEVDGTAGGIDAVVDHGTMGPKHSAKLSLSASALFREVKCCSRSQTMADRGSNWRTVLIPEKAANGESALPKSAQLASCYGHW